MGARVIHPNRADRAVKRQRVLDLLDRLNRDAVVLRSPAATSWYLDGARTHVSFAAPPVVSIRVDRDGDTVLLPESESARAIAEELPGDVTVRPSPWYEPAVVDDVLEETEIAAELRALRAPLLPAETARFLQLGKEAAEAVTDAVAGARPSMSERSLAGRVAAELYDRGADPLVVLVGGHDRRAYRHPLPTAGSLGRRALVVVCARRQGLIVNLSRWVGFEAGTTEEAAADAAILDVEAAYWAALAPGRLLREVLEDGAAAYARAGFAKDEWRNHHQGGAAGYDGRDPRATPNVPDFIASGQAFAWNPSAPGAKVEDTVLFNGEDIDVLTVDPRWPTVVHGGRRRPDVLAL